MKSYTKVKAAAVTVVTGLSILALSACSGAQTSSSSSSMGSTSGSPMMSSSAPTSSSSMNPAAQLVGDGCAAYAKAVPSGSGSVSGMAADPVAVAASNNPQLTTLTKAVSGKLNKDVNLVDTLNGGDFTVIAPTDSAFQKIPANDLNALAMNKDQLTKVLTYHVIPGRLSPDQIAGEHKTVEGDTIKVSGSGAGLMFNNSKLVCGGVMTQNATVYMVDTVLMPSK